MKTRLNVTADAIYGVVVVGTATMVIPNHQTVERETFALTLGHASIRALEEARKRGLYLNHTLSVRLTFNHQQAE